MSKKIAILFVAATYLVGSILSFAPKAKANEEPTVPTAFANFDGHSEIGYPLDFSAILYNPAVDPQVNQYVGQKICTVKLTLSFPKDLLSVSSVNFDQDESNNYSNDDGTVHYLATSETCTTMPILQLFNVTFDTKATGTGAFVLSDLVVSGGDGDPVELESEVENTSNSFSIEEAYIPDPTPNPTPDPTPIPVPKTAPTPRQATATSTPSPTPLPKAFEAFKVNDGIKVPTVNTLLYGTAANLSGGKSKGAIFTGTAEPGAKLNILIQSQLMLDSVTANADGTWQYEIKDWLANGKHKITLWTEKDGSISKTYSSAFVLSSASKEQIALGPYFPATASIARAASDTPAAATASTTEPLIIDARSLFQNNALFIFIGLGIVLVVVILVVISRGKKKKQNSSGDISMNTNAMPSQPTPNPFAPPVQPNNNIQNQPTDPTIIQPIQNQNNQNNGQNGGISMM